MLALESTVENDSKPNGVRALNDDALELLNWFGDSSELRRFVTLLTEMRRPASQDLSERFQRAYHNSTALAKSAGL